MSIRRFWAIGLCLVAAGTAATAATWNSSFDTAKSQSSASGRPILMNFTGSDWCPACQQLRATVLNTPEFQEFADQRLVLMEVDFPRSRPLAALHQQANQQLARKYAISAFPTLLLVNANGEPIGQLQGGGTAAQLIATLNGVLARNQGGTRPPPGAAPTERAAPAPVRDLPLFGGAETQPLPTYTNLVVKSITKTPARRFALINSETLTPGEAAWFKLGADRVKVHCVEVREKSVLVRVDGDPTPRELLLSDIRK